LSRPRSRGDLLIMIVITGSGSLQEQSSRPLALTETRAALPGPVVPIVWKCSALGPDVFW